MKDIVQVAGVIDPQEADLLVDLGVEYIGFPLRLPDGREDLSEADASRIIRSLGGRARAVLITYLDQADPIAAFRRQMGVDIIQLHGPIGTAELSKLRGLCPDLFIIPSLVVRRDNLCELRGTVRDLSGYVDAFITDTFDPATGRRGATGMVHDWAVTRALVELSDKPVILAGGLTPDNVREAIRSTCPAGVDAHTGLEGPDGRKRPDLVRRFVAEARAGFAEMQPVPGA